MNNQLTATGSQVIILPAPVEAHRNGLIIPEEFRQPPNSGVVTSLRYDSELKLGEVVYFNYRQGYEVEHLGVTYLSINEQYILALKNNNTMQPLHDRILVKPNKQGQSKTETGLILLEDQNISEGVVLKTGLGKKDEPMLLTKDDVVIYPKGSGIQFGDDIILVQSDIIAVLNEDEV